MQISTVWIVTAFPHPSYCYTLALFSVTKSKIDTRKMCLLEEKGSDLVRGLERLYLFFLETAAPVRSQAVWKIEWSEKQWATKCNVVVSLVL